ncbi:protein kinase domain-containing protein [Nocardia bovistercoris]|uniref:Protein kinase domain-containing protein n=1 Tax=Nocardia bovistercoris TaxID=2785916 RepID=A0A931I8B4_9NOCA|nr:hypothetical protein [Nocardia bovistercoris]MBH0775966.1 hypothetical protein [Nocardia bovistercoris]
MGVFLPNGAKVALHKDPFGSGAEGLVYRLVDTPHLCAKIYLERTDPRRKSRLAALRRATRASWPEGDAPDHMHAAWPREVLLDDSGEVVGVLMPMVESTAMINLFDPGERIELLDEPTWRTLISVANRTARLFAMLHEAGIVIGDISPSNIFVSSAGHVTLIDCDAVQFIDPRRGTLFLSTNVTREYTPPEATNGTELQPSHDNFGLAVLICQLLMEGDHPFEGVLVGPDSPEFVAEDNIRHQNNRILFPERFITLPGAVPASVLPPDVRALAVQCFGDGHRTPSARPTAQAWADALHRAGYGVMGCRVNPRHAYHYSSTECVWCKLNREGFGERYPAPKEVEPDATSTASGTTQPPWSTTEPTPPTETEPTEPKVTTAAQVTAPTANTTAPWNTRVTNPNPRRAAGSRASTTGPTVPPPISRKPPPPSPAPMGTAAKVTLVFIAFAMLVLLIMSLR